MKLQEKNIYKPKKKQPFDSSGIGVRCACQRILCQRLWLLNFAIFFSFKFQNKALCLTSRCDVPSFSIHWMCSISHSFFFWAVIVLQQVIFTFIFQSSYLNLSQRLLRKCPCNIWQKYLFIFVQISFIYCLKVCINTTVANLIKYHLEFHH